MGSYGAVSLAAFSGALMIMASFWMAAMKSGAAPEGGHRLDGFRTGLRTVEMDGAEAGEVVALEVGCLGRRRR